MSSNGCARRCALFSFVGAPPITGVSLAAQSTDVPGFTSTNLMHDAGAVGVSWAGVAFKAGDQIVLDVTTSAPVPEPAAWALLLAGLAAVPWWRSRAA